MVTKNNFIFARDYTSFMNKNVGINKTGSSMYGRLHVQDSIGGQSFTVFR